MPGTFGNEYVAGWLNTKLLLIHPRLLAVLQAVSEPIPPKVRRQRWGGGEEAGLLKWAKDLLHDQ